jgi:signal transduction histidine kinase/putative methionine-R-sulfoxide reductase with GAF domain
MSSSAMAEKKKESKKQLRSNLQERNAQLRQRLRGLNSLYKASQLMISLQKLDQLLSGVTRLAADVLQAKTASLMLLEEKTNELRIAAAIGLDERTIRTVRMKIGESISGYVVEYGRPLLVKNVETDSRFRRRNRERYETKSLISVPLMTKGKILGVLNLNNKRSGKPFTASDLRLLTSFAAQAAVAVDNVRLLEQNRRKIQELSVLYEIARNVSTVDGIGKAVENVFHGISRIVAVDHCFWFLWEEPYRRLSLAFAMNEGPSVSRWLEGREIYLSDEQMSMLQKEKTDHLNEQIKEALIDWQLCSPRIRCFNSFSILVRGKLHGLFCAGSTTLENISESEIQLISIVISQAASLYEQHAALSSATQVMTMSKVASEIAHDLRHPLTNVKGILQVLENKWYDEEFRKESLQMIHQEIYRLTDLTKELVRFSSPQRFQVKYHDIRRILDRALELVKHELQHNHIEISRQYGQNLPFVLVDESEMLEIFLNLLLNSIESIQGGGQITVSTEIVDSIKDESGTSRAHLRIDVMDNGQGIAPEHRNRIFERYFTTKKNGTGLGLSIARRIVAAHRGFIEVHSVPQKGSTFSVYLPV